MATNHGKGKPSVAAGSKPSAGSLGHKGSANVAQLKGSYKTVSTGKMAGGSGVKLGTTHGTHDVSHPISSSAGSIKSC